MDSIASSKAFVRDQKVFQGLPDEVDEHTTSYYGGEVFSTNGLYVVSPGGPSLGVSTVSDNYGYLPSPPPVPPGPPQSRYLYPENAGHLV